MEIKLGATATDQITGIKGIVTGKCEYITGCDQYLIQHASKDNASLDAHWFDVNRLQVDESIDILSLDTSTDKGACQPAPIK